MIGAGIIWSGLESSPDSAGILPLLCIDFRDRKELQVLLGAELVLGPSSTPSFLRPRALRMPSEGGMILDRTAQMVYVLGKMQRDGLTPSPPEFTTYGLTDPGGGGDLKASAGLVEERVGGLICPKLIICFRAKGHMHTNFVPKHKTKRPDIETSRTSSKAPYLMAIANSLQVLRCRTSTPPDCNV